MAQHAPVLEAAATDGSPPYDRHQACAYAAARLGWSTRPSVRRESPLGSSEARSRAAAPIIVCSASLADSQRNMANTNDGSSSARNTL